MPFRSKAQRGYMYANHPQLAKEFEEATPEGAKLPEHIKKMAEGGLVSLGDNPELQKFRDALEPGVMGDTEPVEQKLLNNTTSALSGLAVPSATASVAKGLTGLGEAGELSLGRMAPKMEESLPEGIDGITAYVKGVQKAPSGDIKIWGVKGDPKMLLKHFGDEAPGSVPEHILRQKGILPAETKAFPRNAPNSYAYGGETNPEHETVKSMENNPTAGFADGGDVPQQPDFMSVLGKILPVAASYAPGAMPNIEAGAMTSPALAQLAGHVLPQNFQPSAPPSPTQDTQFMNQLNQGTAIQLPPQFSVRPQVPSLTQASQTAQNQPSTNYDFYKNMSAEDRAALYQKLTQQQHSGGNLAAEAVGGLGDAISNAFGKGGQHTQQQIMANAQQAKEGQLGAMDTERQQKMQDIQARMTMMEADPNSAYSRGMRQFFTSNGIKVPSGMAAGMLKGLLPDMAKIFESRTQAATQAGAQGIEAGKALMGQTLWDKVKEELGVAGPDTGAQYLENRIGGTKPTQSTGAWKVVR